MSPGTTRPRTPRAFARGLAILALYCSACDRGGCGGGGGGTDHDGVTDPAPLTGIVYVDADAPAGGDGSSWDAAFGHPGEAAAHAAAGAELWVAEGAYALQGTDVVVLSVPAGVSVYGGFAGTESAREERDTGAHVTTLDGGDEAEHVVTARSNVTLDGLTITGGAGEDGAGVMIDTVTGVNIVGCHFTENNATGYGGGVDVLRSQACITGCVFDANTADDWGGACEVKYGKADIRDCTFTGNASDNGGAVSCAFSAVALHGCTLTANTAVNRGGAVCTVDEGALTMTACRLEGNTGRDGGGLYASIEDQLTVSNCEFVSNTAEDDGGGIVVLDPPYRVVNCSFGGNQATRGGAIASTIPAGSPDEIVIANCVLWANTATYDPSLFSDGKTPDVRHSIVQGGATGTGNLDADPLFTDADAGDLGLGATSPGIDSADGTLAPAHDVAGRPRFDDPGVGNTGTGSPAYADRGARERIAAGAAVLGVLSPNGGELVGVGSATTIAWASAGVTAVRVELSRDGGATWEDIVASVDAADASYTWQPTDGGAAVPQAGCLVRVSDASNAAVADTSDAAFTIGSGAWHVRGNAAAGGDGLSWATAFDHPQDAIDVAADGDEIWVAAGTYARRDALDVSVVTVGVNVTLYGGFTGIETSRSQRDASTNTTTLDGEDVATHVLYATCDIVLDGFTVTGGREQMPTSGLEGGAGMQVLDAHGVRVADCRFEGNRADNYGGAVMLVRSFALFERCSFVDNAADEAGGAVYLWVYDAAVFDGCVFSENVAGGAGGCVAGGTGVSIVNSTMYGNTGSSGGAVGGCEDVFVTNCTIAHNTAGSGGGLSVPTYEAVITNTILWGNYARTGRQLYAYGNDDDVLLTSCCVEGGFAGAGNIDGDPTFVDPASGHYRLSARSPCIDAGDGSVAPLLDAEGNARHDDVGIANAGTGVPAYTDIGALEYQGDSPGMWVEVTNPRADTAWHHGGEVTIEWVASAGIDMVSVDVSTDGGATWENVATATPNDGSAAWTVSAAGATLPATDCLVRVSDAAAPSTCGVSPAFLIFDGVWYVRPDAASGGDGLTWATAFAHPQDATDAGSDGDEVWIAAGTYAPRPAESGVMNAGAGMAYYGGFAGTETTRADRDPSAHVTILDAGGAASGVASAAPGCTFDGLTFTGAGAGAGLYVGHFDDVTVIDCRFTQNTSAFGAGAFVQARSARFERCVFDDNTASTRGGGALVFDSPTSQGGVSFVECTFTGNTAADGGGIYWDGFIGDLLLSSIEDCAFYDNTATSDGGGMYVDHAVGMVRGCVFRGNSAGLYGGALRLDHGFSIPFVNCTFYGNDANNGGAVSAYFPYHTEFVGSVLWGNSATVSTTNEVDGFSLEFRYCLVAGGVSGEGNLDADPLFVVAPGGDLRLSAGSPCIDASDGDVAAPYDTEGNPRVDDPSVADTGTGVFTYADIGAFEYQASGGTGLLLTSPLGYEKLPIGEVHRITWAHFGVTNVDIDLSRDGGATWEVIAAAAPTASGGFNWTVDGPDSMDCLVRLTESGGKTSQSAATFYIGETVRVVQPGAGRVWPVGTAKSVTWRSSGIESVRVELSRDTGATWQTLADAAPADAGSWTWTVDDGGAALPQADCLIRLSDADGGAATDTSDGVFTIWGGGVWHVDAGAAAGGNGLSWATAYNHPGDATAVAIPGDQVWVAAGTYTRPSGTSTRVLALAEDVEVYGGFAGSEALLADRSISANPTVLDGEDVCDHVVYADSGARLDGFTITRGGAGGSTDGGGVYARNTVGLVVANCAFTDNTNDTGGGVYAHTASDVTLADCTFTGNAADQCGAGVYAYEVESLAVSGCTFTVNTVTAAVNQQGGCVWLDHSSATVEDCAFTDNTSVACGGALIAYWTTLTMRGCAFDGNSGTLGGAVRVNDDGVYTCEDCAFTGNDGDRGGAVYFDDADATFARCTFTTNQASEHGGAVYAWRSSPTFENCVFRGNQATADGGVAYATTTASPAFVNCSMTLNTADIGGATFSYAADSLPAFTNCIAWGDTATTNGDEFAGNDATVAVVNYTLVAGGHAGTGTLDADPLFAEAVTGNLGLLDGSPCIDAADGDAAPEHDILGNERVDDTDVTDTGVGVPTYVDMGAYERQ